jgi:hypothetical protein
MKMRITAPPNRMACFLNAKPSDVSEEQWEESKTHASLSGTKLPQQTEDAAFYFFLLGDTWEDIGARLGLPIGVLVYTCLANHWHERKRVLTKAASKNKLQKADQAAIDLLTDAIVATTAIYRTQIAMAMRDPEKAKDCPFIPKNLKEIETLLKLFKSFGEQTPMLQPNASPNIHLNIANLLGQNQQKTIQAENTMEMAELSSESSVTTSQDRLRVLELLKHVKEER